MPIFTEKGVICRPTPLDGVIRESAPLCWMMDSHDMWVEEADGKRISYIYKYVRESDLVKINGFVFRKNPLDCTHLWIKGDAAKIKSQQDEVRNIGLWIDYKNRKLQEQWDRQAIHDFGMLMKMDLKRMEATELEKTISRKRNLKNRKQ